MNNKLCLDNFFYKYVKFIYLFNKKYPLVMYYFSDSNDSILIESIRFKLI